MKPLITIGILSIFIGIILFFIGALSSIKEGKSNTKVAIGGFIGFIPFGFANEKRMLYLVIGLSVALFSFWALFYLWR